MNLRDKNGREIKTNDCVRIIASECNKFLDEKLGNVCPLIKVSLHRYRDLYGIANCEKGLKITDLDGNIIWNTSVTPDAPEPCLEVVQMHVENVSGEKLFVADTLEAAFVSWFGEENGTQMAKAFQRSEPPRNCVYVLQMSNNTVKIGVTQNFTKRSNTISTSSGMEVVREWHTKDLPKGEAYKIESSCHKTFRDKRIKGEFFNIPFDDAVSELKRFLLA